MAVDLFKRALPFSLALVVGVAAFYVVRRERTRSAPCTPVVDSNAAATLKDEPRARELPQVHLLSPMLMSEVREFELRGGGYEYPRVNSPLGPHYAALKKENYRRGVLQLNFLFGADGAISEVTPLAKPHDCSLCLQGAGVTQIDPRDPRWREQVEAAKEAVLNIKFEPGTNGGRPVGMHGLAECVFRRE